MEFWLNRYQTFLGVIAAVFAAYYAYKGVSWQARVATAQIVSSDMASLRVILRDISLILKDLALKMDLARLSSELVPWVDYAQPKIVQDRRSFWEDTQNRLHELRTQIFIPDINETAFQDLDRFIVEAFNIVEWYIEFETGLLNRPGPKSVSGNTATVLLSLRKTHAAEIEAHTNAIAMHGRIAGFAAQVELDNLRSRRSRLTV